jgi:hypothetical protein
VSIYSWKDGEYQYCESLVTTKGNDSVPRGIVMNYLKLQRRDAERNLRDDVVEAFDTLIEKWVQSQKEVN